MPVEIWDENINLSVAEFRLLGYLVRHQINLGQAIAPLTQDELMNGAWGVRSDRKKERRDGGCGLTRNALMRAIDALRKREWIELQDVSENSKPRWMVRLLLSDSCAPHEKTSATHMDDMSDAHETIRAPRTSFEAPSNTVESTVEEHTPLYPPKGGKPRSAKDIVDESIRARARGVIQSSIFPYYIATVRPDSEGLYTLTDKRLHHGVSRLLECRTKCKGDWEGAEGLMKVAIDTIAKSDFHMGKHPKTEGRKYNDWEHLFRSAEILEKWFDRSGEGNHAESQGLFD
jgi:hypothetical protein